MLTLAGCVTAPRVTPGPVEIQILAINDFHGNLEPPKQSIDVSAPVAAAGSPPSTIKLPAGGAAYLATAIKSLRSGQPHTVTVSAGDLIGASPLVSSLFLD
jgi:5'-nucleotidase